MSTTLILAVISASAAVLWAIFFTRLMRHELQHRHDYAVSHQRYTTTVEATAQPDSPARQPSAYHVARVATEGDGYAYDEAQTLPATPTVTYWSMSSMGLPVRVPVTMPQPTVPAAYRERQRQR